MWDVKTSRNKKIILIGLVLVLLMSTAVGYWRYDSIKKNSISSYCNGKQDNPLYAEAAGLIDPAKVTQLGSLVKRIEGYQGYQKELNCLIPVVYYYVYAGDEAKAKSNFELLKPLYTNRSKVADVYKVRPISLEDIKINVDSVAEANKLRKEGTWTF